MKTKTLIELLTLSSNLYLIAKDKEFLNRLNEMAEKGKKKINQVMDEFSEEGEDEEQFLHKILHKAQQAKEELERAKQEVEKIILG